MVFFLIISLIFNVLFGLSLYIDRCIMNAMLDDIEELEKDIEFLEGQVEVQQDAMQAAHGNYYDAKGRPVDAPGPWHRQEDAFQLPLI